MENKQLIALAFADLHANNWKPAYSYSGNRLSDSIQPLYLLSDLANKYNVPLLFCGDLVHKPKAIDNEVLYVLIEALNYMVFKGVDMIGIDGNHDQCQKNTDTHKSPSYLKTLSKVYNNITYLENDSVTIKGATIWGLPYYTHNIGFKDKLNNMKVDINKHNILLIHTDLPGAKNPSGFEVGEHNLETNNLDKLFKKFDLVLSGHIHKPQKLSNKVFMLGSPYQQNAGDAGTKMGYWKIYLNAEPKFIPLDLPEYKHYYIKDGIPDGKDIYIPVEDKIEFNMETTLNQSFNNKTSRVKIAKTYLKTKGIKSKSKKKALINILKDTL